MTPDEVKESREKARGYVDAPSMPKGQRHDALLEIVYLRAEEGWTNHQILVEQQEIGRRWGVYMGINLYNDWKYMLGMIARVRRALSEME